MHKDAAVDFRADSKLLISLCGRIAQLVRALASHARGRRFKSYCDHHENQPLACLVKVLNSFSALKTSSLYRLLSVSAVLSPSSERTTFLAAV
jgi:hypothetical protein